MMEIRGEPFRMFFNAAAPTRGGIDGDEVRDS
jgi:hypothetical protein